MARAEQQRIANDWARAWSSSESSGPDDVLALFADECVFEDVTFGVVARGKDELRVFARRAFAAVPDFRYAAVPDFRYGVPSSFALSQWAVIEWVMSGTHRGDFPGIPANGKHFSAVRGSTVLELGAGKIRRESDYWDAATFMKQVGLLPSPSQ
jgi:steroid delta-isomerase-like uncharacterized protein